MIYVIEHGQTALDAKGESHGGRDTPLDAKGRRQALGLGVRMLASEPKPLVIFHSPKRRAEQTARLAGRVAGIAATPAPALAPLRSGTLGAGPESQVARRLAPYFASPRRRIPGGESVAVWRGRHLGFMRRLAAAGVPAAAVTHSNVIGSLQGGPRGAIKALAEPPQPAQVALEIEFRHRQQ
ncbi:MAG: phosphoglycerate mutase family protein [Terriglobales bacterium]